MVSIKYDNIHTNVANGDKCG